jgi:hypothetical protein
MVINLQSLLSEEEEEEEEAILSNHLYGTKLDLSRRRHE